MTVAELIKALESLREKHGDLSVQGVWDDCQWDVDSVYLSRKDYRGDPGEQLVVAIDVDGGVDRARREVRP